MKVALTTIAGINAILVAYVIGAWLLAIPYERRRLPIPHVVMSGIGVLTIDTAIVVATWRHPGWQGWLAVAGNLMFLAGNVWVVSVLTRLNLVDTQPQPQPLAVVAFRRIGPGNLILYAATLVAIIAGYAALHDKVRHIELVDVRRAIASQCYRVNVLRAVQDNDALARYHEAVSSIKFGGAFASLSREAASRVQWVDLTDCRQAATNPRYVPPEPEPIGQNRQEIAVPRFNDRVYGAGAYVH